MADAAPEPGFARRRFVAQLQKARFQLADGSSDASHKGLAAKLGISPARVGDFLREGFRLQISDPAGNLFPLTRLKKAIAGFSASVMRSLLWLQREKLLAEEELTTEAIVADYWPSQDLDSLYNAEWVRQQIKAGQHIAEEEVKWLASTNVEVQTLNWGPFGSEEQDGSDKFLFAYAKDIIKEVDPFAKVNRSSPPLAEILDLQRRDGRNGLVIGSGICETLHRRFRGLRFVTCPLVAFPIMCLLVSKKPLKKVTDTWSFVDLISGKIPNDDVRLAAIPNDLGYTLLSSLDREIAEKVIVELPENIANALIALAIPQGTERPQKDKAAFDRPLAFFADGIAIFDAFNRLSKVDNLDVKIVAQTQCHLDFSYFLGLMLHPEEREFVPLLQEAQQHILAPEWRMLQHVANLLDDIERWHGRFDSPSWPAREDGVTKPIILIPVERLKDYFLTATHDEAKTLTAIEAIRSMFVERTKAGGKRYLRNLVQFTDEISASPKAMHATPQRSDQ